MKVIYKLADYCSHVFKWLWKGVILQQTGVHVFNSWNQTTNDDKNGKKMMIKTGKAFMGSNQTTNNQ